MTYLFSDDATNFSIESLYLGSFTFNENILMKSLF
jgi:hypothetical protein